ncbi:SAM-dependent methyltransferase, MidA family [Cognatiyoonia koreensis]|uniref:SAM-dependent methyltransferase, MidA family n=1 Tax=Cognatiyoonia koreensis TaxID=364200 RepID=A0A1I0N1E6_9RHOB|nr:SAM-dependent methyltransferase [Cognatiyoonia koreensis]SEV94635.1 SAM-dependent methyltransferase, MidA family [Cognatiyoonia koreensis]
MSLRDLIEAQIAADGPMPLSDFMAHSLMHPTYGYYATRDPFGAAGDFTTAPEISQMFGELIGLCLAQTWIDQGADPHAVLVELGPGRGTLMADILRATKGVPGFAPAVHFVETSPTLRGLQAQAVPQAVFHDDLTTVPDAPILLVANEFFDALPIRQFQRSGDQWRERVVGPELKLGLADPAPFGAVADRLADTNQGDIVEVCTALPALITELDQRIAGRGGAALIIDYGDWASLGDTLQALKNHTSIDPFSAPGEADLTAHVDFAAIAKHVTRAEVTRLTTQGVFLERLGITQRAQALTKGLKDEALKSHIAAHRRLTHPAEMGDLFKVIGIKPKHAPNLPGFAT